MKVLNTAVSLLTNGLIGAAILVGALTMYGDWLLLYVHWVKVNRVSRDLVQNVGNDTTASPFHDFQRYWIYTMLSGYGIYFASGLLLHYYYYKLRRGQAEEWKCQPKKWLSDKLELDEIKTGCKGLLVGNTWTAMIACYMANDGSYFNIYHQWNKYPLYYLFLQAPFVFIASDYAVYWVHRIFHWPILYKLFHSVHHRYRQPTAFSVIAIHPFEITVLQAASLSPIFNPVIPIYVPVLNVIALYFYVMGIMNHSGIDFKPLWWQPWQPETMFHDNHHQYFHVNFGFNLRWWDQIHGTIRKADRIYTEEIFWGKGKSIQEASEEEQAEDWRERKTENEKAHLDEYKAYLSLDNKRKV